MSDHNQLVYFFEGLYGLVVAAKKVVWLQHVLF
jgi:hypothetical protein